MTSLIQNSLILPRFELGHLAGTMPGTLNQKHGSNSRILMKVYVN